MKPEASQKLDSVGGRGGERWPHWLLAALMLAVAAAVRMPQLGHSIYVDETWVVDLVQRADLRPHAYHTPPLYYWILRGWTAIWGFGIEALRGPAVLFGVLAAAVPYLGRWLAPATLAWPAAHAWSALLAFSSPLVFYATQVKQYTLDAFYVALLLVLALAALERRAKGLWNLFFLVALVGVTTLFAPVFALAGLGAGVIALLALSRGAEALAGRRSLLRLVVGFVLLGAAFLASYVGFLAPSAETSSRHGNMEEWFAAKSFWLTGDPGQLLDVTKHWVGQALNLTPLLLPLTALALPGWLGARRVPLSNRWLIACVGAVPPLVIAAASGLGIYPYGESRLMIPAYPGLFLLIALALTTVGAGARWEAWGRLGGACALIAFVYSGVARDPYNATYMRQFDLTPLFDALTENRRLGERVHADSDLRASLVWEHPELRGVTTTWRRGDRVDAGLYLVRAKDAAELGASWRVSLHGAALLRVERGSLADIASTDGEGGSDAGERQVNGANRTAPVPRGGLP